MLSATSFTTVDVLRNNRPIKEQLLLADPGCQTIQALQREALYAAVEIGSAHDPLGWMTQHLRRRQQNGSPVGILHVLAHGRSGAFRLGEKWIDVEALKVHANELASWGVETIALWSCHVGADAGFVALLEELTGAQVLASADWLGRDDGGHEQLQLGEWQLSDVVKQEAWPAQFRLEDFDDEIKGQRPQRSTRWPIGQRTSPANSSLDVATR